MILLASTSDLVRVVTSTASTVDVHSSWSELNGTTVTPGRTNTAISSATTTTVVGSPGSGVYRTVKTLSVRNRHATTANVVTILHTDGTTSVELVKCSLAAGESLHYDENAGFISLDSRGFTRVNNAPNQVSPAVNEFNVVTLASDVVNDNAVANTIQDVTGLSFSVLAGRRYWFRFNILYDSVINTTGSRWSVSGPASPTRLVYSTEYSLAATTTTRTANNLSYDLPAASNATSAGVEAGNQATIEGWIEPSSNGTLIARCASEIANSAVTAKAGSFVQYLMTFVP